jgi:hypothetical protein
MRKQTKIIILIPEIFEEIEFFALKLEFNRINIRSIYFEIGSTLTHLQIYFSPSNFTSSYQQIYF